MSVLDGSVVALSRRSIVGTYRQPQAWMPSVIFPLLLAAVYSSQFAKTVDLADFPAVDSFLDFILPASVLQSAAFGATNGANDLAVDIESGFMDRLLASPVRRPWILLGRLAGSAALGAAQAVFLTAVFLAFGAEVKGGVASVFVLILVGMLLALAIGSFGCALALRTGSQEVVQSTFPLIFVSLFVSSAFFPTQLMDGWYRTVARTNPITWIVDPTRRLLIEGWDWSDAAQALGVPVLVAAAGIGLASLTLRHRLVAA